MDDRRKDGPLSSFTHSFRGLLQNYCHLQRGLVFQDKAIIQSTVENSGSEVDGRQTFPIPDQILDHTVEEIQNVTKCGYRAMWFHDLSRKALEQSEFFLGDGWQSMAAPEFYKELKTINGIGHANASYLCRFYGRPHDYTIDKWVMKRCEELWSPGLNGVLKKYGEWAGSKFGDCAPYGPNLLWFSITKYWHEMDGPFEGKWWDV